MTPAWYLHRLRRMSAGELAARSVAATRQRWWSNPARRPNLTATLLPGEHHAAIALPRHARHAGPAADAVVAAANALLRSEWPVFHLISRSPPPLVGGVRGGVAAAPIFKQCACCTPSTSPDPQGERETLIDWFHDPLTGRHAPNEPYCFHIPYRDEAAVGNIKFVWELSRHQPLTLLACAWWLTGDARYAEHAARQLRSWWEQNPFLQGVHWVSGIEVGLRLLAWTWMRALLAEWPGAEALFDANPHFHQQLYGHSRYLRAFHSTGSSANNHLIAEWAGLFAASLAFPWFRESAAWAAAARAGLAHEAAAQTHADGWNREQASAYHLFVAEMLLAAILPARLAGQPAPEIETVLSRMIDALAASLDTEGQPPRFGDSDDARGLLVDAPGVSAATSLLDAGRALFGGDPWWPAPGGSVLGSIASSLAGPRPRTRPCVRPPLFADAGIAILRSDDIWLRCDAGPHGYGSIAAHGHADALSIELRCGGAEVIADPGTYCYHGEPAWRGVFRGTPGHSTLTIGGADQALAGGPFLWLSQPSSALEEWQPDRLWQARHDGYAPAIHHRRVALSGRVLTIQDWVDAAGPLPVMLAYPLGPAVDASVNGRACLTWPTGSAIAALPGALAWRTHRGELDPPLGWYSRGFGQREPATVLAGRGTLAPGQVLETRFTIARSLTRMAARRILIVVENLPVPFDRRVWLEATTLARHGAAVTVICPKANGFTRTHEVLEGVAIYRYPLPFDPAGAFGFAAEFAWCFAATTLLSLWVALFGRGFDVLHACNPPDTFWLLGRFWQLTGRRFIFDHHDLAPEMFAAKFGRNGGWLHRALLWLERRSFRTADVVITTNESHKRVAIQRGGKRPEDVFVVRSGPDLARFRMYEPDPAYRAGKRHLLVYLGEICQQDGVDYMVRALRLLAAERNDFAAMFVGGGPHQPAVKAYAAEQGLSGVARFTGRVPDEELCRILSSATLGIDPDPKTPWSDQSTMNKVIEYMYFGLPVVAFDLHETRVSAQDAGIYAEANSERAMADAIGALLDDPARRHAMAECGRSRVRDALAWDHSVWPLLAAYDRVYPAAGRSLGYSPPANTPITHLGSSSQQNLRP